MNEKWILMQEMHLGFAKETFRRGSVLELDAENNRLLVDHRKFEDTRDLDILKRRSITHPGRPWIIPFSEDALAAVLGNIPAPVAAPRKPRPGENMPVIQSDDDTHPTIDISGTKVSKINMAAKEAGRQAAKDREVGRKMEIIRGDQTVQERIEMLRQEAAALEAGQEVGVTDVDESPDKILGEATESRIRKLQAYIADRKVRGKSTDMSAQAELVELKRRRAKMPVVEDDGSCGVGGGRGVSMNAGQHIPSREEAESKTEQMRASAESRKKQLDAVRRASGIELPSVDAHEPTRSTKVQPIDQDIPPELLIGMEEAAKAGEPGLVESASEREENLAAENETLKAQNEALKSTQDAILKRLEAIETGGGAASPAKPRTAGKIKRTPVTE